MTAAPAPRLAALKFLYPGWFAVPMGLAGLAMAWYRAGPLMGELATAVALLVGGVAALSYVLLLAATLLRAQHHPQAWAEDRRHPVRHSFIATLPVATLLLATVAVQLLGPGALAQALWAAGALGQAWLTWWVLSRWWRGPAQGGLVWQTVTPALILPVVGNVLVPLAGLPLGFGHGSAAQLGIGLLFWPIVLVLLMVRIAVHGMLPERLLPTVFILIAPPAVLGQVALDFGAPLVVGWMCWGLAMFSLFWAGALAGRIRVLAFSVTHWAVSFPLAALAGLTLRLATPGSALAVAGPILLALASIVILTLLLGTWRGLRDGRLLAPEPVASIVPVAAAA
jgi:tellurite resistance protein